MLCALLSTVFAWQDPLPQKPPQPQPAAAATPVEVWDDGKAKAALEESQKLLKGNANMGQKNRALDALAAGSHKLLVKPLAVVVENEKLMVIRTRAAQLLGNQPAADANGTIRRLLNNPRVASHPQVMGALLKALARCGYDKAQWKEIEDLFDREYHLERVPMQEAWLELVIAHKEKQALPILLRNLDEPIPENVDAGSNPPAAYWEARWKSWDRWRGKVRDALFAVTGQRFSTAAEAKTWLQKNPVK
jgi:hypothetical protein